MDTVVLNLHADVVFPLQSGASNVGALGAAAVNEGVHHEHWHNPSCCPDPDSCRCFARMAARIELGLWAEWHCRRHTGNRSRSVLVGTLVIPRVDGKTCG